MTDLILPPGLDRRAKWQEEVGAALADERAAQNTLPSITYPIRPVRAGLTGWWSIQFTGSTGGFVNTWQSYIPQILHSSIRCYLPASTDATGSGQIRMQIVCSAGTVTTGSYSLPSNTNSSFVFNWLHGLPLWDTTDAFVSIQTNAVASLVNVFAPYGGGLVQREPLGATDDGL